MGVFSPASASGVSAADVIINSAVNTTLTFLLANTEYTFTIPDGTKAVMFKARGTAKLQYSYQVGESGTTYVTVKSGTVHWIQSMNISGGGLPVYIQSNKADEVLEIVYFS